MKSYRKEVEPAIIGEDTVYYLEKSKNQRELMNYSTKMSSKKSEDALESARKFLMATRGAINTLKSQRNAIGAYRKKLNSIKQKK
ncbi:MAG: hypothetical protein SVV03_04085 [Candidatus Nanohaloarchaea archaeon]|nr:hypothetical protein [Candidatus Nanohaloarchaea archaeon]